MKWLRLCCREQLVSGWNVRDYRVCERHFVITDFKVLCPRKLLHHSASPSQHLRMSTREMAAGTSVGAMAEGAHRQHFEQESTSTSAGSMGIEDHQRDLRRIAQQTSEVIYILL